MTPTHAHDVAPPAPIAEDAGASPEDGEGREAPRHRTWPDVAVILADRAGDVAGAVLIFRLCTADKLEGTLAGMLIIGLLGGLQAVRRVTAARAAGLPVGPAGAALVALASGKGGAGGAGVAVVAAELARRGGAG